MTLDDLMARILGGGQAPGAVQPNKLTALTQAIHDTGSMSNPAAMTALAQMQAPQQSASAGPAMQGAGAGTAAAQQALAPMSQAQAPQQQPMAAGGGGGGILERLFNPQGSAKNRTIQWLQTQGMDEGTATLMASNKPILQQYLLKRSQGADPMDALKMEKTQLEIEQMRNPTTDDVREYQFAKGQGYQGTFTDFMQEMKKAGAQNITIGGNEAPGLGKLSSDYGYVLDPQTRQPVIDPETGLPKAAAVPGSPAAVAAEREEMEAETRQGVQAATDLSKAETMLDATSEIKKIMKEAGTPVTGTLSRPFAQLSGTAAGKVRSYVGALKSGVALNAILRLKEASAQGATGFGAMNEKELQLLIDDVGALDADTTDQEIFAKTVDRIENRFKRVIEDVKRNVSPERIRELGLESLIAGTENQDDDGWRELPGGVRVKRID